MQLCCQIYFKSISLLRFLLCAVIRFLHSTRRTSVTVTFAGTPIAHGEFVEVETEAGEPKVGGEITGSVFSKGKEQGK